MPLEKNSSHRAVICGYSSQGEGIARIGGAAVFVKGALDGETCRVKIIKAGKTAAWAILEQVETPSPARIQPECPVFRTCGGCALLHMDYQEELRMKRRRVEDAMARLGGCPIQVEEMLGAAETMAYRNKSILAVTDKGGRAQAGFFRARSHDVVPAVHCLIESDYSARAAAAVCRWMDENRVPAYDEKNGKGAVRHIFTRVGRESGEGMVCLVSAEERLPLQKLVDALLDACPETVSIVLNRNRSRGNTVLAGDFRTLWGKAGIQDVLCGFTFQLAPQSFYQVNPVQAQRLYERAVEYADGAGELLELYCGTGTLSLCLARRAGHVTGAEIVPEAVENARENARNNGVENVDFVCADAAQAAEAYRHLGKRPEAVVVDPPRKGLAPQVIESVAAMAPERIVYVSCDPATLARDVKLFAQHGYTPRRLTAVDMFPRTPHVETVVLLSRGTYPQSIEVKIDISDGEITEQPTYKRIQEYVEKHYGFKVHTAYIAEVKRMCGLDMHKAPNAVEQRKHQYHPCPPEKVEAIKDALRHFGMI